MQKSALKTVNIRYFASFEEQAQTNNETITTELNTYRELYHFLVTKYHFTLPENLIKIAVNDEFSDLDHPIEDQVSLVFIPPVAGG